MRIERIGDADAASVRTYNGIPVSFVDKGCCIWIYAIKKSSSHDPVYIGSTSQPVGDRIQSHIRDSKKGSSLPIHQWIRENEDGFAVQVLDRIDSQGIREQREKHWVSQFRNLLNVTDGGGGMSGHKFAGTDHAMRIGASRSRSQYFNCIECGVEFSRKQSQVNLGNHKFCSRECYQSWQRGKPKNLNSASIAEADIICQ